MGEVEEFDRMEHRDRRAARDLSDAADVAGGDEIGRGLHDIREPLEDILQMSIGIDGSDELVIMIMQDSLQRIGLQHKRVGTPSHHVE
jgi:hypothetical protein